MKIIYYLKLIRIQNIAIACMAVLLTAYLIDNYNVYNISSINKYKHKFI